ncbi:MAG: xanthine dehydrogenase family protein molybdopterin-binding subunit [Caldilineaceae bacterium]|nr:xanthine dehydrogenase family protein molybdopterin-binding subunit [Caldilineaceae bacterium]
MSNPSEHVTPVDTQDTAENTPAAETPVRPRRWRMTRRGFLIGAGATAGVLALGVGFGLPAARLRMWDALEAGGGFGEVPTEPWAWFEIAPDNQATLYLAKVEMGQGVHTSLAQIATEELGVNWGDLTVAQATTHVGVADTSGTSGSFSVSSTYAPLRQAAATLRAMLLAKAATLLEVPAAQLVQEGKSFAVADDAAARVTFGEIVAAPGEWTEPEGELPLKERDAFTVIGQAHQRVDIPAKVTGQAVYGYDVKLPGMKFGAVLRPPTLEGTLTGVDTSAAAAMPGVVQVVAEDGFVGVVADSRPKAAAAIAALQATWDEGKLWQAEELDALVTVGDGGTPVQNEGNAARLLDRQTTLTSEYRSPFAVQTPLEAQAALAQVTADKVTVWVSTQMHFLVRDEVAKALAIKPEQVEVIPTYLGGGFGRKAGHEVAVEAARLARAAGVPVHVGWNRTEELRYGYFRPPTHSRLRAQLDDAGRIVAMEHAQASGDVAAGFVPDFLLTLFGADFGAMRGARIPYAVPNVRTVGERVALPVRTGWWRGLGLLANVFALESFMDELAHAAGIDPLSFRLQHLDMDDVRHQRLAAVLNAAAEQAGWGTPLPDGRARGIACCVDADTVVAEVAEVSFDADAARSAPLTSLQPWIAA